ncbi:MAG: pyridoxal phosphate-dependent aminotransferase [Paracoccaceae bacterium]
MKLSDVLQTVPASPIGAIFNRAAALRAAGADLIDLSLGEPDFDTPDHIRAAGIAAINAGQTRYTAADGALALKEAVVRKFARDNGLQFAPSQIVIASGAKPLIAAAMQAILNPGDQVILLTPVWTSHVGMVQVCDAQPVFVPTDSTNGWRLDAAAVESAITPATRLLLLCSPGNPSGAVLSLAELTALANVLRRHPQVCIISDDLYEHVVFAPARFATLAQVASDLSDRILTVNGLSKAYAMTGWRIGYAGGPDWWTLGLRVLFSQTNGGPCSISQAAGIAALDGPQDFMADWLATYRRRRDRAVAALSNVPGLSVSPPEGAFFLYLGCGDLIGRRWTDGRHITSSTDLAEVLLEAGVVTVPGAAFYHDPCLRLSIATSDAALKVGIARIVTVCTTLMEREQA